MKHNTLIDFLINPKVVCHWEEITWQQLLQHAYTTNLTARVYCFLEENKLFQHVPKHLKWHFSSANKVFVAHKKDVLIEAENITHALTMAKISPVFLKGAAYLLSKDPCCKGRLFSDVDIFVNKAELAATEQVLRWQGWVGEELDNHDEKYYRDWMHEIPPMRNTKTNMTIDIHHNLLPLVSRIKLDSEQLSSGVIECNGYKLLSLPDRILHSSAHLLLDGEFKHGFRDLHDIYLLIATGIKENKSFLSILLARSQELKITLILYYCLNLLIQIFKMNIDEDVLQQCQREISTPKSISKFILKLYITVLSPCEILEKNTKYKSALFLLFVRSHWLKMPIHILIPHLLYKALVTPYLERQKQKQLAE